MITEYHRPTTMEDALKLLSRPAPKTVPMGGGSHLSRNSVGDVAVVDLQGLNLTGISRSGSTLEIGACATLQDVMECEDLPFQLREQARLGMGANMRHQSTIAGRIMVDQGRSGFLTALLAMSAQLSWMPGHRDVGLGDFLALRKTWGDGQLIRSVTLPINVGLGVERVARTPADLPVLCVAIARWVSGRTRVALGGFGPAPILVLDGPESVGVEQAVRNTLLTAEDEWASAAYRSEIGPSLAQKILAGLSKR